MNGEENLTFYITHWRNNFYKNIVLTLTLFWFLSSHLLCFLLGQTIRRSCLEDIKFLESLLSISVALTVKLRKELNFSAYGRLYVRNFGQNSCLIFAKHERIISNFRTRFVWLDEKMKFNFLARKWYNTEFQ